MPAAESSAPRPASWPNPRALPAAGASLLAVIAIASLYATASLSSKRPASPTPAAAAYLETDNPPERGTDGNTLQWLSRQATISIATPGRGRYWLAFKAASLREPRVVHLDAVDGQRLARLVEPTPGAYVMGPVEVNRNLLIKVSTDPGAARASPADRRRLAVSFTSLRVTRQPYATFASFGFYPDEMDGSTRLNWLNRDGVMLVAGPSTAESAWVRFSMISSDFARRLRVTGPGVNQTLPVPAKPARRTVVLGPVELAGGLARLKFHSLDPPQRHGSDQRLLSVQVRRLETFGARP